MTDAAAASRAPVGTRSILLVLAFANFVIGMGAFVVIGVLTPVAAAFGISKQEAGWLMTAYALVYAIASPVLVALTGRFDRKQVMLAGLGVFLIGAVIALAAPTYAALLAGRGVMALGGGLVTPVAASIGAALVAPEGRGKALALVFGGLTLAQVLGVPFGAWLGYALGWQAAFAAVTALTALGIVAVAVAAPARLPVPVATLKTLGEALTSTRLMLAVSFTTLFIGGAYCIYTFFTALLEARLGLGRDGVTAMLLLFGLGAVFGNAMGGTLADRIGPAATLRVLAAIQIVVLPLLTLVSWGMAAMAGMVAIWSVFTWSFMAPQQARLAALDPARTPVLFALNAAAIYVGGSLGSLLGGLALTHAGLPAIGIAGAVLSALALLSLTLARRA